MTEESERVQEKGRRRFSQLLLGSVSSDSWSWLHSQFFPLSDRKHGRRETRRGHLRRVRVKLKDAENKSDRDKRCHITQQNLLFKSFLSCPKWDRNSSSIYEGQKRSHEQLINVCIKRCFIQTQTYEQSLNPTGLYVIKTFF